MEYGAEIDILHLRFGDFRGGIGRRNGKAAIRHLLVPLHELLLCDGGLAELHIHAIVRCNIPLDERFTIVEPVLHGSCLEDFGKVLAADRAGQQKDHGFVEFLGCALFCIGGLIGKGECDDMECAPKHGSPHFGW